MLPTNDCKNDKKKIKCAISPTGPAGEIYGHSCAVVPTGLVTVGGCRHGLGDLKDVYLFRNGEWSIAGHMQNVNSYATLIAYDDFFIVFGGSYGQR